MMHRSMICRHRRTKNGFVICICDNTKERFCPVYMKTGLCNNNPDSPKYKETRDMITCSRLIDPKEINNLFPPGFKCDYNRCTGASTAEVFRILGEAMGNPGQPIPVVDRSMSYLDQDKASYRSMFMGMVQDRIAKNGLKHLHLKTISAGSRKFTLTYDIMATYELHQEVKEVWKEV